MKKILILLIVTLTFLCACRRKEAYIFMNETDAISYAAIVMIGFDSKGELQQTEISRMNDINLFMEDFKAVNCYTYYGDPLGITEEQTGTKVVKVVYSNGEYELINWNGQARYSLSSGFRYYAGYHVFDEVQFLNLIAKHT